MYIEARITRITKEAVQAAFDTFCRSLDLPTTGPDAYKLGYNSWGYYIEVGAGARLGGLSNFTGKELVKCMHFATEVAGIVREQKSEYEIERGEQS